MIFGRNWGHGTADGDPGQEIMVSNTAGCTLLCGVFADRRRLPEASASLMALLSLALGGDRPSVNALAILIFWLSCLELTNVTWQRLRHLTARGLRHHLSVPYVPRSASSIHAAWFGHHRADRRRMSVWLEYPHGPVIWVNCATSRLPIFLWPDVPLMFERPLAIIFLLAALAVVRFCWNR